MVLENGIKVYGDDIIIKQIANLVAKYPLIWKCQGFVNIPLEK